MRLVATIAACFVGTLAALLATSYLYEDWQGSELGFEVLQGALLVSVGFLGLSILGLRNAEAAFGRRVELRWLGVAPLVGVAGFCIAWLYAFALGRLLFGEDAGNATDPIPVFSATWLAIVWIAPVAEEWLDRGVLWIACVRANGTVMALWTTSALFALSHGLNGGWLLECPHRMAGGLLLGWLRLRSGSIAAPIVAHATWNLLAVSV